MKRAQPLVALALLLAAPSAQAADDKAACMDAHEHGQEVRLASHWVEARRLFLMCAQSACPELIVQDCTRWVGELAAQLPSLVITARRPDGADLDDVSLSVDGVPLASRLPAVPIPFDPGSHVLRFEHQGWAPVEKRVILHDGEHDRPLVVAFEAPLAESTAPPVTPRRPVWAYVAVGGAIAAAGASVALLAVGKVDEHNLATGPCGLAGTCTDAQVNPIRTDYVASAVTAGVAAAFVAIAVWQLVDHRAPANSASGWPLRFTF